MLGSWFTVYFCIASLSNAASYVDIVAKTDVYVGFLPHHALERLLEKRPIVLLTLAKRLISLLSPLGQYSATCQESFLNMINATISLTN